MTRTVTIVIDNVDTQILEVLPPEILVELQREMSYQTLGAEYSKAAQNYGWDGKTKLINTKQIFPTGLLGYALKVFEMFNWNVVIKDTRVKPQGTPIPIHGVKLRPYQIQMLALTDRTRGVFKAATRTGKTLTFAAMIAKLGVKTLVLTATGTVCNQTVKVLKKHLQVPIGKIGEGEADIENITVGLMQSFHESQPCHKALTRSNRDTIGVAYKGKFIPIYKKDTSPGGMKSLEEQETIVKVTKNHVFIESTKRGIKPEFVEYLKTVDMLIIDECHKASCSTIQEISRNMPNTYYRFGFSATPFRADGLDILVYTATGREIFSYSASQAIRDGWLTRPTIQLIPFKQERWTVITGANGKKINGAKEYQYVYSDRVVNHAERNELIKKIAVDCYNRNETVLIPVRLLEHGENLYKMLEPLFGTDCRWVNGEDKADYLQETLEDLGNKTFKVCIASSIYNEGADIPSLNNVIVVAAHDSPVVSMQMIGRCLTLSQGKSTVNVYEIQDQGCRYLTDHSKSRADIYATEAEYNIVRGAYA